MRKAKVNKASLVKNFMVDHPLHVLGVFGGVCAYAVQQLDAKDWEGMTFINQDAWRKIAQDALNMIGD